MSLHAGATAVIGWSLPDEKLRSQMSAVTGSYPLVSMSLVLGHWVLSRPLGDAEVR
eukprot:SAG11_NODE_3087_length_2703_cov_1.769201_1_plen_56_part_00